MKTKLSTYNVALKIWENASGEIVIGNEEKIELEMHKKLLLLFQVGEFYYYVFNINTTSFEFISQTIDKVLGYPASEITPMFLFGKVHPDDLPYWINFENEAVRFLYSIPKEKMFSYKVRMNFRIQKNDGIYIPILYQVIAIQQDENGKIIRSLGTHTDISNLNPSLKPKLSFIGLNGEPSYVDVKIGNPLIPIIESLTIREKEILYLIIEGKQNKEIADILSISKQTVDKHRKNMISKNNLKNSGELIAAAIKNGWI